MTSQSLLGEINSLSIMKNNHIFYINNDFEWQSETVSYDFVNFGFSLTPKKLKDVFKSKNKIKQYQIVKYRPLAIRYSNSVRVVRKTSVCQGKSDRKDERAGIYTILDEEFD